MDTKMLYLIGGTMGVGKTTVGQILKRRLPDCVFLDGDWCWQADPFKVTEGTKRMVLDNICYLLGSFLRQPEYRNIVFCWVMHEQSIIDEIMSRLDLRDCRVVCVSLMAGEDVLRARLEADVAAGLRESDVICRSIARLPLYGRLDTIKVDTDGKTPEEVAREIMALENTKL